MPENEGEDIAEIRYIATLVRGNSHGLRDLFWDVPGRSIVISEAQMLHLEEHAIDYVGTADGETLSKDRFEFELYEGEHPAGYKLPTEAETATAAAMADSLRRGRRTAAAKALVDAEMADFEKNYEPQARPRARVRTV